MAKKLLVLVIALPVLAGAAYFGGEYLLAQSARTVLARLEASLPPGATLTHGELTTNLLRREVALAGFEVKAPAATPASQPQTFSAANLRLSGLPWISKGSFELGEMVIDGLKIERGSVITAGRWTITRPGVQILNQLATDAPTGQEFSFAAAEVTDLTVRRSNPDLSVSVQKISSGPLAGNRLADLIMTVVKAESRNVGEPLVRLSLDELTADDVDLAKLVTEQGTIDPTLPFLTNSMSALTLRKLQLGPDGGEPVTLEALDMTGEGLPDGTRTSLNVKLEGLVMPAAAMAPPVRAYYQGLGYDRLAFTLDLAGTYNPSEKVAALNNFNLVALDAGTVSLKFTLGGVTKPEGLDASSAQLMMGAITLNSFDAVIKDGGFVKRHVAHGARQLSVEPDVYVEQMINSIRPVAQGGGPGEQKLAQLYRAVSSFLLNPGELTMSAHPEQPVAFIQMLLGLANPASLAQTLNIAAANRQLPQSSPAQPATSAHE